MRPSPDDDRDRISCSACLNTSRPSPPTSSVASTPSRSCVGVTSTASSPAWPSYWATSTPCTRSGRATGAPSGRSWPSSPTTPATSCAGPRWTPPRTTEPPRSRWPVTPPPCTPCSPASSGHSVSYPSHGRHPPTAEQRLRLGLGLGPLLEGAYRLCRVGNAFLPVCPPSLAWWARRIVGPLSHTEPYPRCCTRGP